MMKRVIRLTAVRFALAVFCLLVLPTATVGTMVWLLPSPELPSSSDAGQVDLPVSGKVDVILDPGHGGFDGGAVSVLGDLEKDLNLAMAGQLSEILTACGLRVLQTRTGDEMLDSDVSGSRKMRDLAGRLAIMEAHPDALFVSIHMNRFSDPASCGTQVWYTSGHQAASILADDIAAAVRTTLQPDNKRKSKEATSAIYLLHRAESCAVLVECGFLSNPSEATALASPEERDRLAAAIALGILTHLGRS